MELCPAALWHSGVPSPEIWLCSKFLADPPGIHEICMNFIKKGMSSVGHWINLLGKDMDQKKNQYIFNLKTEHSRFKINALEKKCIHAINL